MSESFQSRYPRRGTVLRPVLGIALLAVTAAACGGGGSGGGSAAAPAPSATAAGAGAQQRPGTTGTLAAISGTTLEVQNPQTGQVSVTYTSSTGFTQTVTASVSAVAVGDCVTAVAPSGTGATAGSFTAQTVTVTEPVNGKCAAGAAFGGGAGGFGGGRRTGTPRPSFSPRPGRTARPGGGFAGAFGQVTSVSGSTFVVKGVARGGGTATTSTVTIGSSTTVEKTSKATPAALAVGKCVTAIGKADDTGAVKATSISIRAAGPNGCTTGFGGRGFGGGGGSGSGGGTTAAGGTGA